MLSSVQTKHKPAVVAVKKTVINISPFCFGEKTRAKRKRGITEWVTP